MKSLSSALVLSLASAVIITAMPRSAAAQTCELGTTLFSVTKIVNGATFVGAPSSTMGVINPSLFASFRVHPNLAIEPQIGFMYLNDSGSSDHVVNYGGQFDYFVLGHKQASPYIFAAGSLIHIADADQLGKQYGGGIGYRFPLHQRLSFRIDGRYMHVHDGGNQVNVGLSIGGVLGPVDR